MGTKALFSLWSPSRESNYKYLVLLMEESCSYKDNDHSDKCKIGIIIMIILVTLTTVAI